MHMCQIAATEGELIYVQGTDIAKVIVTLKLFFLFNNCNAQIQYKYFENAHSIHTSMQPAF